MLYLEKRMQSLECIVHYLDKHKVLEAVKQKSEEYGRASAEHEILVYIYSIYIDLAELFDMNADLGNGIFLTPKEATTLFQEVLFQYVSDLQTLPSHVTSSQICVKIRITCLPTTIDLFHIHKVSDLTKFSEYPGFIKLIGLTTGISGHMKYTQSTKYICPDEQCDAHYSNQYIRMHVPGASETQTIRSDFKCHLCGEILEEIKSLRTLSDQMIAEVVPVCLRRYGRREAFKSKMLQAIPIFLKDELVNLVEIGKTYEFIGICRTDFSGGEIIITLEANNVTEIPHYQFSMPFDDCLLPCAIGTIYKDSRISPFRFPLCMAYHFGEQIVSGTIMIKLRLLLLIGLVLPPAENIFHLIVIGKEVEIANALMTFALQFSSYFPVSVTTPLYGKVSNNRYTCGPYFIEGGSLFFSTGGICPVGDVVLLKKSTKENLKATMASGNILLDLPHKCSEVHTQPLSFPLLCHVWAYYDPCMAPATKCHPQSGNAFCGMLTGDLTKNFLDAFSIVCFIDETDAGLEEDIEPIYFQEDLDQVKRNHITFEDFEQYIDLARGVQTTFTAVAENLILHYYNMSRLARISELGASVIPPSSLYALKALACGLARLRLQQEVIECDAVWAIYLYEEQLTARYGISPLSVQPRPHLPKSQTEEFSVHENDLHLKQFYSKLIRFCSRAMDCHEE